MIVRPFRGRLLIVRQTDHMALSGQLADAWGNDHFARPEPFAPLAVAAAEHDAGWAGWEAAPRLAIVQHDRVATFLFKKTPFADAEIARLRSVADRLQFRILYAPAMEDGDTASAPPPTEYVDGRATDDYARLVLAPDRQRFYAEYDQDIRPITDDRPFFFYTVQPADVWNYLTKANSQSADYKINIAVPLIFGLMAVSLTA